MNGQRRVLNLRFVLFYTKHAVKPANGSNKNKNQRFFHKSPRFLIKENVARLSEIYLKFCGKTTVNVVPAPIVLSARIVPLCRLTIVSAKESPSPSPFS